MEEENLKEEPTLSEVLSAINESSDLIQKQFTEVNAEIKNIKTDITGIKTDITGIKTDITGVKTDITGIKTDIVEIKEDINQIRDHTKCLRFAMQKTAEVLEEKQVITTEDKNKIFEAGQFATAMI